MEGKRLLKQPGGHLGVCGSPVSDVLVVKQAESLDWYMVHLARKAADASAGGQLIETAHAIFLREEANENGLHGPTSLV